MDITSSESWELQAKRMWHARCMLNMLYRLDLYDMENTNRMGSRSMSMVEAYDKHNKRYQNELAKRRVLGS